MGIYDRDYTQQDDFTSHGRSGGTRWGLPQTPPVVTYLLIANIVMFLASLIPPVNNFFYGWLAIDTTSAVKIIQAWRLITYQFLHNGFWHIFFNMLGLFFLGPTLERHWGSKRFLRFYLMCGIAGGLFYTLLSITHLLHAGMMVGASGAMLGLLAACAILFPHFVVFIFVFPVPIRIAAIIFIVMYILNIAAQGANAGGDAAHFAGMVAGAGYVFLMPLLENVRLRRKGSRWEKKMAARRNLQIEVDRIL
ncbi:MAG: rhomboid family intramembrane serine protease, partial [Sedimentisphaerales bacterium]|nr:rhomboid family intramembrane serine protease [Sedimentisphaerales bacterium]